VLDLRPAAFPDARNVKAVALGKGLRLRRAGEVIYYATGGLNPYDMNVCRMDSHDGWLVTARDLAMFAQPC
jgi:hypothetical protein